MPYNLRLVLSVGPLQSGQRFVVRSRFVVPADQAHHLWRAARFRRRACTQFGVMHVNRKGLAPRLAIGGQVEQPTWSEPAQQHHCDTVPYPQSCSRLAHIVHECRLQEMIVSMASAEQRVKDVQAVALIAA